MSLRLLTVSALALGLVAAPAVAQDARTEAQAAVIRDAALKSNVALDYVTQITTRFGPRPAGSRSEQQAAAWAADYLRAQGFQNVRIEEFPLVGWERGEDSGAIIGAHPQPLVLAALGHSPATPRGGIEADVVRFTTLDDLRAAPDASVRGKIVYVDLGQMHPMQDGSGYGPQTRVRGAGPGVAAAKGAAAFILRSVGSDENRLPHTGTTQYVDGKATVPSFALSAPDADQVSRLIALGEPVRLRLSSTARTYQTHSQNVIGDLPGATRPDEIIVLGSHMDSWDQGTGAIDDAAGGAITIAAAKAIAASGQRAARTIRVVLYGSEEVA
ncbi:M28 family peptidase [Brevundimonas nasdae]